MEKAGQFEKGDIGLIPLLKKGFPADFEMNLPKEVAARFKFYRALIPKAFKKGYAVELLSKDIVELLAFNYALNNAIEAGVFDKKILGKRKQTLTSIVLNELGDLAVHRRDYFIVRMIKKGHSKQNLTRELNFLIANGLVQEKISVGKAVLIGRGSCLALMNLKDTDMLKDVFKIEGKPFIIGVQKNVATYFVDKKGRLVRDPPYKQLGWPFYHLRQINESIDLKLIDHIEVSYDHRLSQWKINYKITELGKLLNKVLGACIIVKD